MYALREFGNFHAGGRIVSVSGKEKRMVRLTADTAHEYDPNGDFLIEQVYVQYLIPAEQTFPHPLPPVPLNRATISPTARRPVR